jgi:hypothetical protein
VCVSHRERYDITLVEAERAVAKFAVLARTCGDGEAMPNRK